MSLNSSHAIEYIIFQYRDHNQRIVFVELGSFRLAIVDELQMSFLQVDLEVLSCYLVYVAALSPVNIKLLFCGWLL